MFDFQNIVLFLKKHTSKSNKTQGNKGTQDSV